MKKRYLVRSLVIIAGLSIVTTGGLYVYEETETRAELTSSYSLTHQEIEQLKHGDIIMRKGYGLVSRVIATKLQGDYELSHCGVVIEREGMKYVVHTVSASYSEIDGVQVQTISDFIRQSKPGSVVVNRFTDEALAGETVTGVMGYLKRSMPFDNNFDITDTSALYCTELIWRSLLERTGVDLFEGRYENEADLYSFDVFFNSALFETVLNHQEK